jgi:hypothetical protein
MSIYLVPFELVEIMGGIGDVTARRNGAVILVFLSAWHPLQSTALI